MSNKDKLKFNAGRFFQRAIPLAVMLAVIGGVIAAVHHFGFLTIIRGAFQMIGAILSGAWSLLTIVNIVGAGKALLAFGVAWVIARITYECISGSLESGYTDKSRLVTRNYTVVIGYSRCGGDLDDLGRPPTAIKEERSEIYDPLARERSEKIAKPLAVVSFLVTLGGLLYWLF